MELFSNTNTSLHTLRIANISFIATRSTSVQFQLPSIVVLDISGSTFLAKSILRSSSSIMAGVKVLNMSWCSITSFPKSKQEQILPSITHLDLSHNPLTCDCQLTWIPDQVRDGKLTLENEEATLCVSPSHLYNIPLLTATLCPHMKASPTTAVPELTIAPQSNAGKTYQWKYFSTRN